MPTVFGVKKEIPDKWVVVGLVWLIACLNYTDRMTIFSIFPVLKKELCLSDITLALIGSSFLWFYGIFSPIGGYLGDRFSRRSIILGSLLIFSGITFYWSRPEWRRVDRP
jgi:MFS family permease